MAPCPVCLEEPTSPVTLDCAHQLCGACLAQLEDRSRPTPLSQRCPTCRQPLPRVAKAYARAAAALKAADAAKRVPKAEQRFLEAAVVALRVVVDVMPDHHDARLDLGLVLKRLGRAEDSVRCLAQCAQDACGAGTRGAPGSAAGVGARVLGELVGAYGMLGMHDRAEAARRQLIAECRCALRGSPENAPLFAALLARAGAASRGAAAATAALADLDVCALHLPASEVATYRAGLHAARADALGRGPAALVDARKAAAFLVPDAPRSDTEDYASSASDGCGTSGGVPPLAEFRAADVLAANGDAAAARAIYRALARSGRAKAVAAFQLGLSQLRAPDRSPARLRRAARSLRRARADRRPGFAAAVAAKLGEAHLAMGDPAAAAEALRAAVALEPHRVASRLRLATALEAIAKAAPAGAAPYRRLDAQRARRAAGAAVARERAFRVLFSGELGLSCPEPAAAPRPVPDDVSGGDAAYRAGLGRVVPADAWAGGYYCAGLGRGKTVSATSRAPTRDRAYRSAVAAELAAAPAAHFPAVWRAHAREYLGVAAG